MAHSWKKVPSFFTSRKREHSLFSFTFWRDKENFKRACLFLTSSTIVVTMVGSSQSWFIPLGLEKAQCVLKFMAHWVLKILGFLLKREQGKMDLRPIIPSRRKCVWQSVGHKKSLYHSLSLHLYQLLPDSSVGKESACNAGDRNLIPGLGGCPGEGNGYPLQYSGLEHSMRLQRVGHNWATFTFSHPITKRNPYYSQVLSNTEMNVAFVIFT